MNFRYTFEVCSATQTKINIVHCKKNVWKPFFIEIQSRLQAETLISKRQKEIEFIGSSTINMNKHVENQKYCLYNISCRFHQTRNDQSHLKTNKSIPDL